MKRVISVLLLISMIFALCSCGFKIHSDNNSNETTTSQNNTYPKPASDTVEQSENTFGARYNFTLNKLTEMLNNCYAKTDNSKSTLKFKSDKWQVLSDELCDDNDVKYTSYYYMTDTVILTASVENDSKKVMNVGCGCTYDIFNENKNDFKYSVLTMAAMISSVAGGYDISDIEFFYRLFTDVENGDNKYFYNNSAYFMTLKDNGDDSKSIVLFLTLPVSDSAKEKLALSDYINQ